MKTSPSFSAYKKVPTEALNILHILMYMTTYFQNLEIKK